MLSEEEEETGRKRIPGYLCMDKGCKSFKGAILSGCRALIRREAHYAATSEIHEQKCVNGSKRRGEGLHTIIA